MPRKIKPVKITHPGGLESVVDEPSVPHWERSGWSRADAPATSKTKSEDKSAPASGRAGKEG